MSEFTQKYTIVHLFEELPDGFEYSMKSWPPHVTLADVFSIDGEWTDLLESLRDALDSKHISISQVNDEDFFGDDRSIQVMLLEKNSKLQHLHDTIVDVLESFKVKFNSPQYTKTGFMPHATKQQDGLKMGDLVKFNSITLIDMFPDKDPYQRKVLGTIRF